MTLKKRTRLVIGLGVVGLLAAGSGFIWRSGRAGRR